MALRFRRGSDDPATAVEPNCGESQAEMAAAGAVSEGLSAEANAMGIARPLEFGSREGGPVRTIVVDVMIATSVNITNRSINRQGMHSLNGRAIEREGFMRTPFHRS